MATTNVSFKEIQDSFNRRNINQDHFTEALDRIRKQNLPLADVKSCVMLGCGSGDPEIEFIRSCLPNVGEVVAVEPDAASVIQLRENLSQKLPSVTSVICQETAETWKGVDRPVDAVMAFHLLNHLGPAERPELIQKLSGSVLTPGGLVFILTHPCRCPDQPSDLCRLYRHLKTREHKHLTIEKIKRMMCSAGFQELHEMSYDKFLNVEEPDDAFLSLVVVTSSDVMIDMEEVRQAAREVFGNKKTINDDIWFGIYTKQG